MTQRTAYLLTLGLLLASCLATQAAEPKLIQTTCPVVGVVIPLADGNPAPGFGSVPYNGRESWESGWGWWVPMLPANAQPTKHEALPANTQTNGLVITPESPAAWGWCYYPQPLTPNPGNGMWGWGPTPQPVQPVKYEAPAPKPEADFMGEVRKEMAALLVRKYHQACQQGLTAEAKCIADEALELDPACFSKARTAELECK